MKIGYFSTWQSRDSFTIMLLPEFCVNWERQFYEHKWMWTFYFSFAFICWEVWLLFSNEESE